MGFDRLNHDCICDILELVDDASPQTTKNSIRFVNKEFYATTKITGHRRKTLRFPALGFGSPQDNPSPAQLDISSWLSNDDVLRGLHYLTISDGRYCDGLIRNDSPAAWPTVQEEKFDSLATLIAKLGNLKSLDWSYRGPVPLSVLGALHKHQPKAELRVYNFTRLENTTNHQDPAELALSKSPALTLVRASLWGLNDGKHPDLREAAFKRVVASAPNLRYASVIIGHSGCDIHFPSDQEQEELEELTTKFLTHKKPNSAVRTLTLDGYPLHEQTLKDWGKLVELSSLESLKCSRGLPDASYFKYAPQVLTNLKHVSLNLSYRSEDSKDLVPTYISETAPLESLSLWSWMNTVPLDTILTRHGETLKTLQLHERETTADFGSERRRLLSVDDLKAIKDECTQLRDLTIDIDRHSQNLSPKIELKHYADKLDVLASMNLDKLQIYFDLGIATMVNSHNPSYESESEAEPEEVVNRQDHKGTRAQADGDEDTDHTSSSPRSPPPKRQRKARHTEFFAPSPREAMEPFVKELWKKVFGNRPNSTSRGLDVKFGEWERKMGRGYPASWVLEEQNLRTLWIVRPDERDDRRGECVVTVHGGYASGPLDAVEIE